MKKSETARNVAQEDPAAMCIKYLGTHPRKAWQPETREVDFDTNFEVAKEKNYKEQEKSKATSKDEIFIEALQINANLIIKLLWSLWKSSSKIIHQVENWTTAEIISAMYKMGCLEDPASYRPHPAWAAKETGTETVTNRHIGNGQKLKYSTVLDLIFANNELL